MRNLLAAICFTTMLAAAQEQPDTKTASISGVVLAEGTSTLLAGVEIGVNIRRPNAISTTTDEQGRYRLSGLPAGTLSVTLLAPFEGKIGFGPTITRQMVLAAGQSLDGINWKVPLFGQISGRVLDENKEPVPGIWVILLTREYSLGAARYVMTNMSPTDDQGEYRLKRALPGRGYIIVAQKSSRALELMSQVPVDAKKRKRVTARTFYPNVSTIEAADVLILSAGEHREAIDISMTRSPSLCIEGSVEAPKEAGIFLSVAHRSPVSGTVGDGGFFMSPPGGILGSDHAFRLCDLSPGEYVLQASSKEGFAFWGSAIVPVGREDVTDVRVYGQPRGSFTGAVVLDGTPPDPPLTEKLRLHIEPMTRAPYAGEFSAFDAAPGLPGDFAFQSLFADEYRVRFGNIPEGWYMKEATFGNTSLLREPFRTNTATGNTSIRIVLARDGGTLGVLAANKESNPIPNCWIYLMPVSATPEAVMAASVVAGQADQTGAYKSRMLAPGKYLALAMQASPSNSYERVAQLWNARSKATEVEISAGGNVQITLEPID